jgi:hypothetical protein
MIVGYPLHFCLCELSTGQNNFSFSRSMTKLLLQSEYQHKSHTDHQLQKQPSLNPFPIQYQSEYRREFCDPKQRRIQTFGTETVYVGHELVEEDKGGVGIVDEKVVVVEKMERPVVDSRPHQNVLETSTSKAKVAFTDDTVETIKEQQTEVTNTTVQTDKDQQQPQQQSKSKKKIDAIETIHVPKSPKQMMAPYGIGNTNPVVATNHMKTFNVRAPQDQVPFYSLDLYHHQTPFRFSTQFSSTGKRPTTRNHQIRPSQSRKSTQRI